METQQRYELYLNHISALESFRYPGTFEEYKNHVADMLQYSSRFVFEDDLMEGLKNDEAVKSVQRDEPLTMRHIQTAIPDSFVNKGESRKKNKEDKEPTPIWYNVWDVYYINPDDGLYYDLFFVYKIRGLDLLELDDFLNYQLEIWYENNLKKFTRFLQLIARKHGKKLLSQEHIQTINEWIADKGKHPLPEGKEKSQAKPKIIFKRNRNEKSTRLNQEQTALLIYCLRETRIILGNEYLDEKYVGQAFSMLTGFSENTLSRKIVTSAVMKFADIKNTQAVTEALKNVLK